MDILFKSGHSVLELCENSALLSSIPLSLCAYSVNNIPYSTALQQWVLRFEYIQLFSICQCTVVQGRRSQQAANGVLRLRVTIKVVIQKSRGEVSLQLSKTQLNEFIQPILILKQYMGFSPLFDATFKYRHYNISKMPIKT